MRVTPTTLEQISTFEEKLVKAFRKMVLGINVELSDKGKETYKDAGLSEGRWYFIKAINDDESITLISQTHHVFKGLTLSDIQL